MNDWQKLKRHKLETPPSLSETTSNLQLPEVIGEKVDKRTLRKTGRTKQFATRVSKEWLEKVRGMAEKENLKLVEVLEKMLESYNNQENKKTKSNKQKVSKKKKESSSQELYPHYPVNFTCDNCGEEYVEDTAYSFVRDWVESERYLTYCSNCVN